MPNRLAQEQSPYLQQHAANPVEWFPWGDEAIAKARSEQKPIFLSVGYSTCHWCHVMAHESFEDPAVAAILNEHFVNIKVDREERPDVDHVYMTFVQATTGHGGWPMSVWLTPSLKPFFGGTYFAPDGRYGRPGFSDVLRQIAEAWSEQKDKVEARAGELLDLLQQRTESLAEAAQRGAGFDPKVFELAARQFARSYDEEWGGFGQAPKFPRPSVFEFLLRYSARERKDPLGVRASEMVFHTLRKMADGGMHDHVGGGFHRYSVDEYWHVPHFEKMLYDQGQIACSYIAAFQLTGDAAFARVAEGVLDYVFRDLRHPDGGFFSAEDADSLLEHGSAAHAEGAFYVWTKAEVESLLLPEEARLVCDLYDVKEHGNAPRQSDPHGEFEGKNILLQRRPLVSHAEAELLRSAKAKLFAARQKRPRPHLDDKILTAWNGLMISGFARAGAALDRPEYIEAARASARFIADRLTELDSGTLLRAWRNGPARIGGFAEDYAFYIQGLLDLYEADFDPAWLRRAGQLQEILDRDFHDEKDGLYFSNDGKDPTVLVRSKSDYDGAEPSANAVIALNLVRLAGLLNRPEWRAKAENLLGTMLPAMQQLPHALPMMLGSLDAWMSPPGQLVITAPEGIVTAGALLREIRRIWRPNLLLLAVDRPGHFLCECHPELVEMLAHPRQPAAWLCENFQCRLPLETSAALAAALQV